MDNNEKSNSDFLCTYFSQTFDDLRFFKQKMNEVTYYSILLQGGLIGVFKLIGQCGYEFLFKIFSLIVAVFSMIYILRTHCSLMDVRKTQIRIVEKAGGNTKLVFYNRKYGDEQKKLRRRIESCCYNLEFTLMYFGIVIAGLILTYLAIAHITC